jgi:hypothetical protein
MRRFPIFIFLFVCACASPPDKGEKSPSRATHADSGDRSPAAPPPVQAASADGVAELRRRAATQQPIFVNTLDVDSVAAGEFVPDEAGTPSAYAGQYHFGGSEWESTLTLSVQGSTVTGVLGYAEWENETWVGKEVRFGGGTIAGASLSAPGWMGVFVRYQGQPGLVILRGPTEQLGGEFGTKLGDQDE